MILILSGTDEGKEIAVTLSDAGLSVVSAVPTMVDAAKYGTLNAIAGEINFLRLTEIIKQHNITGIIDAKRAFDFELSSEAKRAANECGIPYIKYVKHCHSSSNDDVINIDTLDDFYDFLEANLHNTLLDIDDNTIEIILDGLAETDFLFIACTKGVHRDYLSESLNKNIPITNVLEVGSGADEEENYLTYTKHNIKNIVIKAGAFSLTGKIAAAKRANANVIALDTDRLINPEICSTLEQVLEAANSWA